MSETRAQAIAVWGASGHARVVAETLRRIGGWSVVGFIDDVSPERAGSIFCDAPVLGGRASLAGLRERGVLTLALGFGHNAARLALMMELSAQGFSFPVVIHPSAVVAADASVGEGSFVGPMAVINSGAVVGRACIVNTGAIVEHDSAVEDGVHLSPRACLAGKVRVGRASWVGAGAVVRDKLTIGADCMVGMGSVVVSSVADGAVVYGCPAVEHKKAAKT